MADDQIDRGSLKPHVQTYNSVIGLLFWGAIAAAVVAALVILLIAT